MKTTKLIESNELEKRAQKHKKKSKGLSPFCSLNTDAGNVEHNVAMFNMMNSPADSISNNPVSGPHGGDVSGMCEGTNKSECKEGSCMNENVIDLHYDDLTVDIVTKPQKPSSHFFEYGRDEAQTKEETVAYDYPVEKNDVVEVLYDFVDDSDMSTIHTANDDEIFEFISRNIEELLSKYGQQVRDHFRTQAKEHANMNLNESVDVLDEYIIMGIKNDGTKQYYNRSSVPHWVDKGSEATIFDDMDEARLIWLEIDKRNFKRVFIPVYDHKLMNEAVIPVDRDQQYLVDLLRERIEFMMDYYVGKYYQTIPNWPDKYKVNTKHGRFILEIQFDTQDLDAGFVFSIDGKPTQTIQDAREAAKYIIETARRKYVSTFNVAVESIEEDWNPPEDWVSYKGAWIYPVNGGYEANFMGQHFEGETIEDLKIKLTSARIHKQHFSGEYEKAAQFADNIKKFGRELPEGILDRHYDESEWEPEDIELHKNTDWKARNYRELPVPEDSFEHEVVAYGLPGGTQRKKVKFIKYIRANEIFPPYYAPEEDAFEGTVGVMYDGAGKRGKYDIHNRYETQDVYDALSEEVTGGRQISGQLYNVYDTALNILHEGSNADVVNNIKKAFESIGGEGFVKAESSTYIKFTGYIPWEGHEEYVIQGSISMSRLNADFAMLAEDITMAYYRTKLGGKLYSTPELMKLVKAHQDVEIDAVREGWSPDLIDCPACGDVSFDSKRGRCTKCSYRESLDEALEKGEELTLWWKDPSWSKTSPCYASVEYVGRTKDKKYRFKSTTYGWEFILDAKNKAITDHNGKTFDADNSSGWLNRFDEAVNEWYEFSEDDFEDDQMHANVYGGDTKYCKDCGAVKSYDEDGFSFCPECDRSSMNEKLSGYKMTIKQGDKTFDDYACAYEEDGAIQQMKNKYGKDIEVTSINVSKVIKEASYGGAYDITDDQYFTREELNEFADRVVSELNEIFNDKFEILDASIDDGMLTIEVEGNELGWYMEKVRIDMRKIKTPSDLQRIYAPEMIGKFSNVIRSYNQMN